tara:strand:- start:347 stop:709 length:363 start_codon:yes stop_codon:yes gene_type:complete
MQQEKEKEYKWHSGIASTANMSYEKYLKMGLEIISPRLSVRVYKTAQRNIYPTFTRGTELRVQIFWNNESKYEFIVDRSFWYHSNTNKDDRKWMRSHANVHLSKFYDAMEDGKKKRNASK